MERELLSFSIRLKKEVSISYLLEIADALFEKDSFKSVFYEYNTDIQKCIYKEKRFKEFESFYEFYNLNEYRFDMLKFETNNEHVYLGFQQTRGDLRVFGRIKNRLIFDKIIGLSGESVLYAYLHNSLDMLLSRTDKTRSWNRRLGYIPDYIKTYRNPRFEGGERDEFLIDLKSFPTNQHLILTGHKLWFGACAEMYFSNVYYDYIPENNWNKFDNCLINQVLLNGLRKIKLYDNLDEFEKTENRDKQWTFRKELNIDYVANQLKKN